MSISYAVCGGIRVIRSFPTRRSSDLPLSISPVSDDQAKANLIDLDQVRRRDLLGGRSEEHTSELQSHVNLVCRLRRHPSYTLFPYTALFRSPAEHFAGQRRSSEGEPHRP